MTATDLTTRPNESGIVKVMAGLAADAAKHLDVTTAHTTAHYALSIVVNSEDDLRNATEAGLKLAKGRKTLAGLKKPLTALLTALRDALNVPFGDAETPIVEAEKYLANQELAYRRRLEAEADRARRAEEVKRIESERAAREAEAAGLPAPPPKVQRFVEAPPTQTKVVGGESHVKHDLKVELANVHEAAQQLPEGSLVLASGMLAWVRERIERGDLLVPKKMDPVRVRYCGLDVYYEPNVAKRMNS